MRRTFQYAAIVVVMLAVAALSGGCGGSKTSAAAASTGPAVAISIEASAYSPADVTIKPGTTVTWTNTDTTMHTVSSDNGDFDSGQLQPGGKYSYTFPDRGTFQYRDNVHPTMYAKVSVVR